MTIFTRGRIGETLNSGRKLLSKSLASQILSLCRSIAGSRSIVGACVCGSYVLGQKEVPLEVLLIIDGFSPGLMNQFRFIGSHPLLIFALDKRFFERDVEQGFLGEAFAIQLLFPYIPVVNYNYLKTYEIKLKRRIILECMESLVLDFPELSYELQIRPEYFLYEALLSRVRLFPPMLYTVSNFLRSDLKNANVQSAMEGFCEALKALESEGIVEKPDECFKISKDFINNVKSKKVRFTSFLKISQKTLFMHLLAIFPNIFKFLWQSRAILRKFLSFETLNLELMPSIEDPKTYLLVPTANGLAPLSSRFNVEAFARKVLSSESGAEVEIKELGGILNDVYLVSITVDGEVRRVVVKSFKNWSNFKWFPIAIWTIGTVKFAFLGKVRLEREYAINRFLHSKGFAVPRMLGIYPEERLIIMEYLEGETLDKLVKRILEAGNENDVEADLKIVYKVGEILAKVHALNIALGDTKPENILAGKDGRVCILDLEQASRNGDKAWDVAEFIYYTGHYVPLFRGTKMVELVAETFIKGYLAAGGDPKFVKAAGKTKYTKVFSVFVFPHVISALSNLCKKVELLG